MDQELFAAAAGVLVLVGTVVLIFLARGLAGTRAALGEVRQGMRELGSSVSDLRQRVDPATGELVRRTFQVQTSIQRDLLQAQNLVSQLRAELGERKKRDDEVAAAVRHLEAVLAGTPSKGAAGENILAEAFSQFPPGMVERNYRVGGKVVEFALVLGNDRRMPIDSKWPATPAVERLATDPGPDERRKAVTEIQAAIRRKVREVARYIDPLSTTDRAIAAIPDAAYPHCGELAFEAYRQGVIIMPYSMTVPYVLNLYNLHLKYARSIDLESLDGALTDIERNVETLEDVLDNRIRRGTTMLENAYGEVRQVAARIRSAVTHVRALPPAAERPSARRPLSAGTTAGRDELESP